MKKQVRNPWSFSAPDYDHRSSNAVNAGTHHGVGKAQPVGHEGDPKMHVPCLPYGKPHEMRDDEVG
jgi:hypothetical protein